MSKSKVNFFRLIFAIVLGGFLYLLLMHFLLKSGWNFNVMKISHWNYVWEKWNRGWVIREKKEVLFFCLILSIFPGWILMSFATYSFRFKNLFLFPLRILQNKKRRELMKQSLDLANGKGITKPSVAASSKNPNKILQKKSNPTIDKLRGKQTSASASEPQTSSAPVSSGPKKSFEQLQLEHLQRWNDIAVDLEENDIFCFRSTKIGSFAVKLTVLTKEAIFWFIEGPLQPRKWKLMDDDPIGALWVSGDESIPSPLKRTYDARETFKKHLSEFGYDDVTVHAFVVMDSGSLQNPSKITEDLSDWDIAVLKMPPCEDEKLSDLSAIIKYIKGLEPSAMEFNDAVAETIMALEAE